MVAGYTLAVTVVESWLGSIAMMGMTMPPMPGLSTEVALLQVIVGLPLVVVAWPLLRLRFGTALALASLTVIWAVTERRLALDPAAVRMWLTGPVVAFALTGLGLAIARRWRWLPAAAGVALLVAAIATPVLRYDPIRGADAQAAGEPVRTDLPDVLLVVLDTVRSANMSTYGYERPTAPVFSSLAADGALFLDATAPSTWSLPSHASLFTGLLPSGHGSHGESRLLGTDVPTLAEILSDAGYDTACFTANPHISDSFGLARGFHYQDRAWAEGGAGASAFMFVFRLLDRFGLGPNDKGGALVTRNFESWWAGRGPSERPAFMFVNFLEAHFPYHKLPADYLHRFTDLSDSELSDYSLQVLGAQFGRLLASEEAASASGPSVDMYDGGVLYSDMLLGRLVETLKTHGRLDETVLVVLADHGEMLGEHGLFGHGAGLYEPDTRVPLLVRYPPSVPAARRVPAPVSTLGVLATILDLADVESDAPVHVGSLLPALEGRPAGAPVITERYRFEHAKVPDGREPPPLADNRRYRIYREDTLKLASVVGEPPMLFDLASDPGELRNVASERPDDVRRLADALATWEAALGLPALDAEVNQAGSAVQLDPVAEERLRALGYIE